MRYFLFGILVFTHFQAMSNNLDRPCAQDAKVLCPNVQPGEGRIRKCLKENKEKVSEACKQKVRAKMQARKAQ